MGEPLTLITSENIMIREINVITGVETHREYTPDEQAAIDVVRAKQLADKPMVDWKFKMAETDAGMPRSLEDLITAGSLAMNDYQKAIYDAKIKRRSEKP